jgi:hypothetical protein
VSRIVPNLHELLSLLEPSSDAALVTNAFDAETMESATEALRKLVSGWDETEVQVATKK